MAKFSNRQLILAKGLRVVHARGFTGASVRDIVKAAGVPQGSFTNHFVSKEAFALEILNLYFERTRLKLTETLLNHALTPLNQLKAYVECSDQTLGDGDVRNGCLFGNFSIEASEHSEIIRKRLIEIFDELKFAVASSLRAAVTAGELPATTDCAPLADFFISSLQGATLRARVERSAAPIKVFKKLMFSTVLASPTGALSRRKLL